MKILGIETSCDETAIAIIEAKGTIEAPKIQVLSHTVLSQIKIHEKHGGVFPMLAKREHSKNLVPIFEKNLKESSLFIESKEVHPENTADEVKKMLEREPELLKNFLEFIPKISRPDLDYIAVTEGPGLEPALWVGINFAKALSTVWNIPVIPVNHMEGHIVSVLLKSTETAEKRRTDADQRRKNTKVEFPALALLISGGHTELISAQSWGNYEIIGETLDDAVGEAFDKVGRMLALPYPAGAEISRLAAIDRTSRQIGSTYKLPRPMIKTNDFNFSFSGLKTAVLYILRKINSVDDTMKREIAREFEDAVVDVLVSKTKKALHMHPSQTLIVAGGVSANSKIRNSFEKLGIEYGVCVRIPDISLSTDNAVTIAAGGFLKVIQARHKVKIKEIVAKGNLRLA